MKEKWSSAAGALSVLSLIVTGCVVPGSGPPPIPQPTAPVSTPTPVEKLVVKCVEVEGFSLDAPEAYSAVRDYVLEHYSVKIPNRPWDWPDRAAALAASGEEFTDGKWAANFDPPTDGSVYTNYYRIIVANLQTGFRWEGGARADIGSVGGCDYMRVIRVTEVLVTGVPPND